MAARPVRSARRTHASLIARLLAAAVVAVAPATAAAQSFGDSAGIAAGTLVVRRADNPAYRPPPAPLPAAARSATRRVEAVDRFRFRLGMQGRAPLASPRDWALEAGRAWSERTSYCVAASGTQGWAPGAVDRTRLRGFSVEARRPSLSLAAGDLAGDATSAGPLLDRLRGASVRREGQDRSHWRALAGAPAGVPGLRTPRMLLAQASLEQKPLAGGLGAAGLLVFSLSANGDRSRTASFDSTAGQGATLWSGLRLKAKEDELGLRLAAQMHDLDGNVRAALRPGIALRLQRGALAVTARGDLAPPGFRSAGADGVRRVPLREGQGSARVRVGRRSEAHVALERRAGGPAEFEGSSVALGGSSAPGGGSVHLAGEYARSRRGLGGRDRRLLLQAGGSGPRTGWLARLLHAGSEGSASRLQLHGELSGRWRGARLALVPRVEWSANAVDREAVSLEYSGALPRLGGAVWAAVGLACSRERAFRPGLYEASLRVSLPLGAGDRLDLEAERVDEPGLSSSAFSADYSSETLRYAARAGASPAGGRRLEVRVVRAADGTGVENALVSLDGRDHRFTDSEGRAVFEAVPGGPHEVALEEASLAQGLRAVGARRLTVRVARERDPEPVLFEVARPERRTGF